MTLTHERPVTASAGPVALRNVFAAVMKSEWSKLRTVRSTIWTLIFTLVSMIGIGTLLTALEVSRWNHRSARDVANFDPLLYSFGGVNLAQLSIGVLGVLVMTSEYGTGAIKLTLTATPQRRVLLAGKVATFSLLIAVVSLVSCLAAFFIGQDILASKNAGVSITDPNVLRAVLGAVFFLTVIGVIGVGVGTIVRHTAGSVAILFAVLLVIPGLVLLLPSPWNDNVSKYLPGAAGESVASVSHLASLLAPGQGLLVLCAYAAATLGAAGWILTRRDA